MSIEAITFEQGYAALPQMGYAHAARVKQDMEQVRRAFPDLEPYVAQLPSGEILFLVKGTLAKAIPNFCPQINFVVTVQQPFPNCYPILTVEEPQAPWRFANHPNVDTSGQTYLVSVSNWNPQGSTIFQCVNELRDCLSKRPPFENTQNPQVANRPAAPPAQPLPPPQQQQQQQHVQAQPVRQMQPQPMAQPQPVRQQQVVYQQVPQQQPQRMVVYQQPQTYDDLDVVRAVARTTLGVAGATMSLLGTGARVLAGTSAVQGGGGNWVPPRPRGNQQTQRQERMKADFLLLLNGKLNVPPGTEIVTPDGFCISRFMTSRTNIDDGLLAPGPAPMPMPPCTEPTPHDQIQMTKQQDHLERERAAAAAAADTTTSTGWKMLSAAGRMVGKVASTAKNTVEDTVRNRSANDDLQKFKADFPQESQSEKLIMEYSCYGLSGDGVARKGRLYVCERVAMFLGSIDPPANSTPMQPGVPPAQALPFRFYIPYNHMVCLLKGECCNKKFLHFMMDDGTFRSVTDFTSSLAGKVGNLVSSAMQGSDAYERCWNWIDHLWRAATQVPSPTYHYAGQPGPLGNQPGYRPPQQGAPNSPQASYGAPPTNSGYNFNRAQESPQPQQSGAPGAKPEPEVPTQESPVCTVCMEAPKNAFFQPCGHVCCCLKCANQVKQCPMCRAQILQVFPAFIS